MIHHVFANKSNIGDWLSARGIQSLLKPHQVVEHLCDEPFVPDTLAHLATTTNEDLIVIGGGGLFMDYFTPFWIGLRDISPQATVCIWGVGYCDLKAESSHPPLDVVLDCIRASRICVVRDELTRNYLDIDSVGEPVACPSMVAIEPSPGGRGILHVDNYTTAGADTYAVMDQISREFADSTNRPFRRTNNRIKRDSELEHVLSLYEASDLIVSSALHGCIIAVAMGKPVCAISGDRKIEAFMEAAGLGKWVLDVRKVKSLSTILERLMEQQPVPDYVKVVRSQNKAVASRIKSMLADLEAQKNTRSL